MQNNITKCETLLRSSRQIYILENIFTYHKTQLHGKNTFTKDETNLHFRKQTEYYTTPVVETSPVVPSGPRPLETPNTDHT